MIKFSCSKCQHRIGVKDTAAGRKLKCPRCGTILVVPQAESKDMPQGLLDSLASEEVKQPTIQPSQNDLYQIQEPTKECPYCGETILEKAKKCKHCGEFLHPENPLPSLPFTPGGYQSYESIAHTSSTSSTEVFYAGFWRRFVALMLDSLILALICFFPIGIYQSDVSDEEAMGLLLICFVINNVVQLIYFTLWESSSRQATPGKMAMGIKVTDIQGNRISFGRAMGRYLGKIISNLLLGFGFLMAGFTQKKQALHDLMADCLVVRKQF